MKRTQQAWLVMIAAYLAGVAVTINQAQVPPVMDILMAQLKIDTAIAGWLMSTFAIAGVVLGIPAALILSKWGPRLAGLAALGFTIIGAVMGALATGPALLLISRAIEGIGLGLIIVVSPAVISMWFPAEERGLPMGIWASWVPVGAFIIYNLASPLVAWFGWQGLWWFGAGFAMVAFIVYALIVRAPEELSPPAAVSARPNVSFARILTSRSSLVLAGIFATYCFASTAFSTWAPTFFGQRLGLNPQLARFDASLASLAVIPSTILAGWVLDHTKRRELVFTLSLALVGVFMFWSFRLTEASIVVPYMLAYGLIAGFVPTATFTMAPETVPHPELMGIALGMVSIGQNLGTLLGAPVVGILIAGGDWSAGVAPLVVSVAIGVAASIFLFVGRTPIREETVRAQPL
jgi:MFS family permease